MTRNLKIHQKNLIGTSAVIVCMLAAFLLVFNFSPVKSYAEAPKPELQYSDWLLKHSIADETNIMNLSFTNSSGKILHLQRYNNHSQKWETIHKQKIEERTDEQNISVPVKAPSEPGKVKYRIVSGMTYYTVKEFTVLNHSLEEYSEYEMKAYNHIKNLCGNAYITTGTIKEMTLENGVVALGLAATTDNKITLKPGMDDEKLEWVAKHECGHILQHNAYDQQREKYSLAEDRSIVQLNKELTAYYPEKTDYSEKNADCIAKILSNNFTSSECQGNRGQAAHNIIQGKVASDIIINESYAQKIVLNKTGYATDNAECSETDNQSLTITCVQQFEKGKLIAETDGINTELSFVSSDGTTHSEEAPYFRLVVEEKLSNQAKKVSTTEEKLRKGSSSSYQDSRIKTFEEILSEETD